jgi:RNA polymerase sigma-70 factor, ECF subfamily
LDALLRIMSEKAQQMAPPEAKQVENSAPKWSDEELVSQVQAGRSLAMEELVRRYQNKVYGIAYSMCSENVGEAEDITQEAFLRAFRSINRFRGESSFYTWLYRIAANLCMDKKRIWHRWQRIFRPWSDAKNPGEGPENSSDADQNHEPQQSPADLLRQKQLSKDVQESLRSLPEKQRIAFQLKVFQGMSIHEIAQVMGTAEGTVKSHLFRATHSLRDTLKEWGQP